MAKASDYLIAMCDGHGPETAGKRTPYIASLNRQIRENEFNKAVVDLLETHLKRQGFRTLQTAPTDYDTPLTTRTNKANAAGADIYISVHFNAMGNTFAYSKAEGFSVHIQEGSLSTSKAYRLAKLAVEELAKGTPQVNRGIVRQNLAITRQTKMPAILVEGGFMDDEREALLMVNPAFQREVAQELAEAVCRYFDVSYVPERVATVSNSAAAKAPAYASAIADRRGEVRLKADAVYRRTPDDEGAVISTLKKGHTAHYYDMQGHWVRLGNGWVKSPHGSVVEITKEYGVLYRVFVDGAQVGAYSETDNALTEAQEAIAAGAKNIRIEKA